MRDVKRMREEGVENVSIWRTIRDDTEEEPVRAWNLPDRLCKGISPAVQCSIAGGEQANRSAQCPL